MVTNPIEQHFEETRLLRSGRHLKLAELIEDQEGKDTAPEITAGQIDNLFGEEISEMVSMPFPGNAPTAELIIFPTEVEDTGSLEGKTFYDPVGKTTNAQLRNKSQLRLEESNNLLYRVLFDSSLDYVPAETRRVVGLACATMGQEEYSLVDQKRVVETLTHLDDNMYRMGGTRGAKVLLAYDLLRERAKTDSRLDDDWMALRDAVAADLGTTVEAEETRTCIRDAQLILVVTEAERRRAEHAQSYERTAEQAKLPYSFSDNPIHTSVDSLREEVEASPGKYASGHVAALGEAMKQYQDVFFQLG